MIEIAQYINCIILNIFNTVIYYNLVNKLQPTLDEYKII